MATRFYLPGAGTSPVASPGRAALWTHTGANTVAPLLRSKTGTSLEKTGGAGAAALSNVLLQTFVSEPLAAQTVSGNWTMVAKCYETATSGNASLQLVIRVLAGDTSTTRGTIYAGHAAANNQTAGALGQEMATSPATRIIPSQSGTSVVAQAGDRLCVEVGYRADNNTATTSGRVIFRDSGADYALTAGLTTDLAAWLETTQNLAFVDDAPGMGQDGNAYIDVWDALHVTGSAEIPTTGMQPLTSGPRAGLSESVVLDSLSWQHSTALAWGADVLNRATLADTGIELTLVEGSVTWQARAEPDPSTAPVPAEVRRTGSLTYRHLAEFNPLSVYFRPWVEMQASTGEWVRWHLGVFTGTMPPYQYEGQVDESGPIVLRALDLADRSHLWQTSVTDDPVYVAYGTRLGQWVRDDLQTRFGEPAVSNIVTSAATASQDYVFESGTSWLEIYNTLLGAIGNEPLHTDAEGRATSLLLVDPETRAPEHDYSYGSTVLAPASVEAVNPELPNVIRFVSLQAGDMAIEGEGIRTVINEATGPASRQARGGQTVLARVEVDAQTQTELDAQARALAPHYFGGGGLRYTGQVGLNPRHGDADVVSLDKPAMGISGTWLVTQWSINLGGAEQMATMTLELEQLTGAAFVSLEPVPVGAYGTVPYGHVGFGMAAA